MGMSSLRERFEKYERTSELSLTPRLPIIIRVSIANPKLIFFPEKPFTETLGTILSQTLLTSIKELEGSKLGFFCGDEFNLVILPSSESDLWMGNNIQKISSFCASLFSLGFNNHSLAEDLEWAGKVFFTGTTFVLPTIQEVINYLIFRQHEGGRDFLFKSTKYILLKNYGTYSLKELSGASASRQLEIVEENGFNLDEFPSYFQQGIGCYKMPKLIKNDYGTTQKDKWGIDHSFPLLENDQGFIRNILESGRDIFRSERDLIER